MFRYTRWSCWSEGKRKSGITLVAKRWASSPVVLLCLPRWVTDSDGPCSPKFIESVKYYSQHTEINLHRRGEPCRATTFQMGEPPITQSPARAKPFLIRINFSCVSSHKVVVWEQSQENNRSITQGSAVDACSLCRSQKEV